MIGMARQLMEVGGMQVLDEIGEQLGQGHGDRSSAENDPIGQFPIFFIDQQRCRRRYEHTCA